MHKHTKIPGSVWGVPELEPNETVGYDVSDAALAARIPAVKPTYRFNPRFTRFVRTQWMREISGTRLDHEDREPILVIGPPSAGKSSGIRQMAARLSIPVFEDNAHEGMRVSRLMTSNIAVTGTILAQDGPLAQAAKTGSWFLLNEINSVSAQEMTKLLDFLETGTYTVTDTGEVIRAARGFMFFATMNPSRSMLGVADAAINVGTKELSDALKSRFEVFRLEYDANAEREMVQMAVPTISAADLDRTLKLVKAIRSAGLPAQFGNRQLIRFARKVALYKAAVKANPETTGKLIQAPVIEALDEVFANALSPEGAVAVRKLAADTFG